MGNPGENPPKSINILSQFQYNYFWKGLYLFKGPIGPFLGPKRPLMEENLRETHYKWMILHVVKFHWSINLNEYIWWKLMVTLHFTQTMSLFEFLLMLNIYCQLLHFTQFLFFLEGLRMSLWVPIFFLPIRGFFNPLLGDFWYQYFKKPWKFTNFSVNYLKDICVNVENKLPHEPTNVLKFSKHPQLLFQLNS